MSTTPTPAAPGQPQPDELKEALRSPRRHYMQALRLSLVVGVLMLAPSWFMFEVYGRVLNSRNETTLWWLLLMAIGVYVVMELVELARHRALHAAAHAVEERLTTRVFDASFAANLRRVPGGNAQGISDLRTVTDFIASPAVTGVLDLPAALLCLLLLYLMSPWLGLLALVTAAVHVGIGLYQERNSSRPYGEANRAAAEAQLRAAGTLRNAQVIESMGMELAMHKRWTESQQRFMLGLGQASDRAGAASAASKMLVQLQGSLLLGLAVWLALNNALWGGAAMAIVASILGGRVLAPLAQLVAQWRAVGNVRSAYKRVQALLKAVPAEAPGMLLPPPKGVLITEGLVVTPPGGNAPVLKGVSFGALPGEMLTVIGPSAAGKSTLARSLIGVWPSQNGKVRLDGADVFTWHKAQLGPYIGYLPQGVELFDGTVAENIARFGKVDMELVRKAADDVGITATIEALPEGFDTQIGDEGAVLSGGQRQRMGLARAIYGDPKLVVLDEPNSSLDDAGEKALIELIQRLKSRGTTVISITHRMAMLAAAEKLLLLNDGMVSNFGPRDDVLTALKNANEQARAKAAQGRAAATAAPVLQPQGARP
jgi:ATP-binding cassette subfamily C exporter for protease/lipase